MDGFILRYFPIKLVRILDRAVFYAGRTTRAFVLYNVSGLLDQGYPKISCLSLYTVNFSIGQDLYIRMPADLDQFGRQNSHGAVIGGKGLVKLGHMATNARCFLYQVNLKTGRGKIKRGLNTADPSTHNHYVSKIAATKVCRRLQDFFDRHYFVFHYSTSFLGFSYDFRAAIK